MRPKRISLAAFVFCFDPQDFLTPGTKRITHAPSHQPKPTGCGHGPELHFFQQHFGLDPSKIQGLDTHQGPENRVEDMASGVAKPVVVKNGGVMGGEVGVVWFFLFFDVTACYINIEHLLIQFGG